MISLSLVSKPTSLLEISLATTKSHPLRSSLLRALDSTFSVSAAKPTRVPLNWKTSLVEPRMSGFLMNSIVRVSPVFLIFCSEK